MSETVVKTIDLIIAPVVMITACGIMQNGLLVHYNSITTHLRSVNQEILTLLELDVSKSPRQAERLHHLEHLLLPNLFYRNHVVHNVLGLVYLAILTLILDMLVIAIAISTNINWLSQLVLLVFLLGVGILFWSIVLIAHELRTSHNSLQIEVHHTCEWCQSKSQRLRQRSRKA
jgi:hypothetical protein